MKFILFPFLALFCFIETVAQPLNRVENPIYPHITINKVQDKISLDGVLDEATWQNANGQGNFSQYSPVDTILAEANTVIYMAYDDDYLYIAAKCSSPTNNFVVQSLRRDYGFGNTDNISFNIDTYSDKTNSFLFGMNAFGVRREALISEGGKARNAFDPSWDNKWDGESKIYEDYWICEMAIPFKILRFKSGSVTWRFNAYRRDMQLNEISTWINIPREYVLMDMQYMGLMQWEEPLKEPSRNISLIPFVTSGISRDFEDEDQLEANRTFGIGGDAKIALSSSMNLDLTINPDFSQVEVDRQVTNLDRFEIFFPERRQFFLENADLFSRFGNGRVNPFFSRRIGVSQDTTTGNNIQNTIYGGARMSGKLTPRLRVGLLSMQTAEQVMNDLPSFNHTVIAAEQNVFDQSSVAAIVVNKQAYNYDAFGETENRYDRVVGLEYRLRTESNLWTGKASFLKSFNPLQKADSYAHTFNIQYNKERIRLRWDHLIAGYGFEAEDGFVPRKDILLLSPEGTLRFFPKSDIVIDHSLDFDARFIYKLGEDDNEVITDFGLEEVNYSLEWRTRFKNNTRFGAGASYNQLTLLNDFDPTRIQADSVFLAAGEEFTNISFDLSYNSDERKTVFFRVNPFASQFFGGNRLGFSSSVSFRYQPYGSIAITTNFNHIDLGDGFEVANLWLVGPRLDLTFTRNHFLTAFVQYNSQFDNVSINTRYQWRFAPASDFFLVYTDNYNTEDFSQWSTRNKGVIAKLTYWLNI